MASILVIDDHIDIQLFLSDALRADGHTVTCATDGMEGLERALLGHPNVVITDLSMPRMTGEEFIGRLQAIAPHIPIIVMSAKIALPSIKQRRDELHVHAYFEKPFDVNELRTTIKNVLAAQDCPRSATT
jgi:CheY-like chemotaxis protein